MSESNQAPPIDFGVLIAFVAPGFLALVALAWVSPVVGEWLTSAREKEQTVGAFLFASLSALSLGLAVSGLRALIIDRLFWRFFGWSWVRRIPGLGGLAIAEPNIPWDSLDAEALSKLVVLRDNYYRYYQFYANMAVALALWVCSRALGGAYKDVRWFHWALHVVGVLVLLASAHGSLARYCNGVSKMKGNGVT